MPNDPTHPAASALRELAPLWVVIPAYNAARVIESTTGEVTSWLSQRGVSHRVVVVDDGSTDDTAQRAERVLVTAGTGGRSGDAANAVLRMDQNRGKGAAVRAGMLAALRDSGPTPAWAVFLDADHSTHIRHLEGVALAAARGADLVIGSRRVVGANEVSARPTVRRLLGRSFPLLCAAIARTGVEDTQCGFKAVRGGLIEPLFAEQRVQRFAFDVELLLRARRMGASIHELPVAWDNPAESTLRVSRDAPAMLRDTIRASWYLRRGGPAARALRAWPQREGHLIGQSGEGATAAGIEPKPMPGTVPGARG
jgi:dolichyl-phosphate beta-glucosyltransferase